MSEMTERTTNALIATIIATIMVATAIVSGWVLVASGVLWGATPTERPVQPAATARAEPAASDGVRINGSFQLSQPRDPFRPLITPDSPVAGIPGVGGPSGGGGFTPATSVTLVAIRNVGGTLRATIIVDGVSYDVGEGETFAGSYKVVSLTDTTAVIMYGDTVFELQEGEQILK